MNTRMGTREEGYTGLGVLILMAVALIASQLNGNSRSEERRTGASLVGSHVLLDDSDSANAGYTRGSIREISVLPTAFTEYSLLGWTADEELISRYRRLGL